MATTSFTSMHSPSTQLHTAARRFALEAHDRWAGHYMHSGASDRPDSAEARGIFPRYLVHEAMRWALETFDPADLPADLAAAREVLAAAALDARSAMTDNLRGSIETEAMEEERRALAAFIRSAGAGALAAVAPLPYRRVLRPEERRGQERRLAATWGVGDGYWYPLEETSRVDVIAFEAPEFYRDVGAEWLRGVLRNWGVTRILELPEFAEVPALEEDLEAADFRYTGAEGFWFDRGLEWIVYASHESSLTVGGRWLVDRVMAAWPEWRQHLWRAGSLDVRPPAT